MMMINVPWHFKVGACAKGKKKTRGGNHYSPGSLFSSIYWLARYHTNLKLDLTIILISQLRGDLIG